MFGFFKKTISTPTPASHRAAEQGSSTTQQHTDIQRELVRVVLKDTLRLHGVPAGWLSCEVVVVPRRAGHEDLIIQLIVLKWNQTLLQCALALEEALLSGLDRFDPSVDHSRYIVSWRFAPGCGCPLNQMPESNTWLEAVPQPAPKRPKFDLPPSDRDFVSNDFAPTEPIGLRDKGE